MWIPEVAGPNGCVVTSTRSTTILEIVAIYIIVARLKVLWARAQDLALDARVHFAQLLAVQLLLLTQERLRSCWCYGLLCVGTRY